MIIIFSSAMNEQTTDDVMQWLYYYNECVVRINEYGHCDMLNGFRLFEIMDKKVEHSVWYRRSQGYVQYRPKDIFYDYFETERQKIDMLIESKFRALNHINKFSDNNISKLEILWKAKKIGLAIPETAIGNSKTIDLKSGIKYITKAITEAGAELNFKNTKISFGMNLQIVYKSDLVGKKFGMSFFQEYIEKKFELRIFYLKGKFKSMAIFSQENEKTKEDYRNYDFERPNRCVPFKLPSKIEKLLTCLMKEIDLNCGSIDMIVTPTNEFYFLEVNPVGQMQWLSKN